MACLWRMSKADCHPERRKGSETKLSDTLADVGASHVSEGDPPRTHWHRQLGAQRLERHPVGSASDQKDLLPQQLWCTIRCRKRFLHSPAARCGSDAQRSDMTIKALSASLSGQTHYPLLGSPTEGVR